MRQINKNGILINLKVTSLFISFKNLKQKQKY